MAVRIDPMPIPRDPFIGIPIPSDPFTGWSRLTDAALQPPGRRFRS